MSQRHLILQGFFVVATAFGFAADQPVPRDRYLLIEDGRNSDTKSPLGSWVFEETGVKKDSELGRLFLMKTIAKWKVFEDERVRFSYPDHPGITVKAADRRAPVGTRVYGGPVGSVGRKSSRYYTIGADEATWAVIMLQSEPWLDEGVCLCGAVSLRVYVPHEGCLRAYDLLEDGQLKKMQVQGDGVRLQVFEWTHLPMSQESYLRLTESVSLKNAGAKSAAEWSATFHKQSKDRDPAGWLTPGMREQEVVALLGQPDSRQKDTLVFKETDEDQEWLTTTRIPLPGGVFRSLPKRWRVAKEIPPTSGTLRWALKLVDDDERKLSKAELAQLETSCLDGLKSCPASQWNQWCQVARRLTDNADWKEPTLGPLIASRFLDKEVIINWAAGLLGDLNPPGTQELVRKRLRFVLDGSTQPEIMRDKYLHFSPYGDFHNLVCQIKPKEQRLPFIREAIAHPHRAVRWSAYLGWVEDLPPDEAISAALKGLDDEDESVRQQAAEAFEKEMGSKQNIPALKKHVASEKDERTRESLAKAIQRLESKQ